MDEEKERNFQISRFTKPTTFTHEDHFHIELDGSVAITELDGSVARHYGYTPRMPRKFVHIKDTTHAVDNEVWEHIEKLRKEKDQALYQVDGFKEANRDLQDEIVQISKRFNKQRSLILSYELGTCDWRWNAALNMHEPVCRGCKVLLVARFEIGFCERCEGFKARVEGRASRYDNPL